MYIVVLNSENWVRSVFFTIIQIRPNPRPVKSIGSQMFLLLKFTFISLAVARGRCRCVIVRSTSSTCHGPSPSSSSSPKASSPRKSATGSKSIPVSTHAWSSRFAKTRASFPRKSATGSKSIPVSKTHARFTPSSSISLRASCPRKSAAGLKPNLSSKNACAPCAVYSCLRSQ